MRWTRETKFAAWALAAVAIAAVSFFAGAALKPDEEPYYIFETEAPAYEPPAVIAATSPGGFTGFGETDGSNTRVVIAGRVVEKQGDALVLEDTYGQRTSVGFAAEPRITRLASAEAAALQPGATVAVRLNEAGDTVEAVLVLSTP